MSRLKLEVAAEELGRRAAETAGQGEGEVPLNRCVCERPTGHRDGTDPVEFVAQGLPILPFEEFSERHGFTDGEVHHRESITNLGDATRRAGRRAVDPRD
jgi:hypothetical protein